MESNHTSIESSLIESMKSENLSALLIDNTELVLDQIIDHSLLKELPFLGNIVKIYGTIHDIKAILFIKKMINFLYALSAASIDERRHLVERFEKQKKGYQKLGEIIISTIDKVDDSEKAMFIGKLFAACSKRLFSTKRLLRLVNIISNMFIDDIKALSKIGKYVGFSSDEKRALLAVGLMDTEISNRKRINTGSIFGGIGPENYTDVSRSFTTNAFIIAEVLFNANRETTMFSEEFMKSESESEI